MTTTTINKGTPAERVEHRNADGKLHRADGPAIEWADGGKAWYRHGKLHRDDGPAVEWADGYKEWCRDGLLHRADGPAIELADGTKKWCRDGLLHRDDGPAIEYADGINYWYRDGKPLTEAEFQKVAGCPANAPLAQVSAAARLRAEHDHDFRASIVHAHRAGHSQRAIATAAGFKSPTSIQRIIEGGKARPNP